LILLAQQPFVGALEQGFADGAQLPGGLLGAGQAAVQLGLQLAQLLLEVCT